MSFYFFLKQLSITHFTPHYMGGKVDVKTALAMPGISVFIRFEKSCNVYRHTHTLGNITPNNYWRYFCNSLICNILLWTYNKFCEIHNYIIH